MGDSSAAVSAAIILKMYNFNQFQIIAFAIILFIHEFTMEKTIW